MMNLLALMFAHFRWPLLCVLLFSSASAGLAVLAMAFINERLLQHADVSTDSMIGFGLLLAVMFGIATTAQILMTRLGHRLVYQLRRILVKRVLDTDCDRLEQLGPARILASLNGDVSHITSAFINLPAVLYGLVLCVGGLAYLAWLSIPLFVALGAWLLVTVIVASALMAITHRRVEAAREIEDRLYEDYQAVVLGRKELTLNRDRARCVYEAQFEPHARQGREHEIAADVYNSLNENWANAMVLGAIGLCLYLARGLGWADAAAAATCALTILFLRTPLTSIVMAVPTLIAGSVALRKIDSLELQDYQKHFSPAGDRVPPDWRSLRLERICYRYPSVDGGNGFSIGP